MSKYYDQQKFFELCEVNASLKGIDVKGKEYVLVNDRVMAFRRLYPTGFIITHILKDDAGKAVIEAEVGYYEEGERVVLATGHAYEKEGSTFINKTSYIENCETSAIGRALAMMGIGIDTSIASYEEVANAQAQQSESEKKEKDYFVQLIELENKLGQYEIDRKTREFVEYVNKKAGTNYGKLEAMDISNEDAPKIIKIYKAMIREKVKNATGLDVNDQTETF